jgi:hypothetical protein
MTRSAHDTSVEPLSWLFASVLAAALVHVSDVSSAKACVSDGCSDPVRTFGPDAIVPANLVRFAISDQGTSSGLETELRTTEGSIIALRERDERGHRVLEPAAELEPGTELELHYGYECYDQRRFDEVYRFSVSDDEPLVLVPATLTLIEEGMSEVPTGFKRYRFEPPVSASGAHLVEHVVTLDGQPLGALDGGPALREGVLTVHASCDGLIHASSCGGNYMVGSGGHQLSVTTTVVGEAQQPEPFVRAIEVECPSELSCAVERPGGTRARTLGFGLVALAFVLWHRRRCR